MNDNIRDTNKLCYIIMAAVVVYALTSCEAYVDYLNNTPVRTQYIERPYYPNAYHSFYGAGGLGYYNNFYRPVYQTLQSKTSC